MKFGWPISIIFHALFVAGGVLAFSKHIDTNDESRIIPVEMLSVSEFDNIRAAAKSNEPEEPPDTPMQLETPMENAPDVGTPDVATSEPETPTPANPPTDTEASDALKPEEPTPPAFDLDSMSALIDKTRTTQPDANQQQTLQSEENFYAYAENARRGVGEGTDLSISEITALKSAMYRCWRIPLDAKNPEELIVSVRVRLRGNGTVQSADLVDPGAIRRSPNPYMTIAAQRAVNAVSKCAPYDFLPSNKYDTWKDMVLRFKPEL